MISKSLTTDCLRDHVLAHSAILGASFLRIECKYTKSGCECTESLLEYLISLSAMEICVSIVSSIILSNHRRGEINGAGQSRL